MSVHVYIHNEPHKIHQNELNSIDYSRYRPFHYQPTSLDLFLFIHFSPIIMFEWKSHNLSTSKLKKRKRKFSLRAFFRGPTHKIYYADEKGIEWNEKKKLKESLLMLICHSPFHLARNMHITFQLCTHAFFIF